MKSAVWPVSAPPNRLYFAPTSVELLRSASKLLIPSDGLSRSDWPQLVKSEKRGESAEAEALREEVSVLREQLRALEERLEKKREK